MGLGEVVGLAAGGVVVVVVVAPPRWRSEEGVEDDASSVTVEADSMTDRISRRAPRGRMMELLPFGERGGKRGDATDDGRLLLEDDEAA